VGADGAVSEHEEELSVGIIIEPIELLALKKLAVICGALGQQLGASAKREQLALTQVLVDVCHRAEVDNARAKLGQP
jgi:hypothetical protein